MFWAKYFRFQTGKNTLRLFIFFYSFKTTKFAKNPGRCWQTKTTSTSSSSSADLSVTSILSPLVWVLCTQPTLLSFMVKFLLHLSLYCEKKDKIDKKRPVSAYLKSTAYRRNSTPIKDTFLMINIFLCVFDM